MKRTLLLLSILLACGPQTGGSLQLNFPADLIGDGILSGAVFDSGRCADLPTPIDLSSALVLVRLSHPADFDAQNEHPMTLSSIRAGADRMVVAVIEQDGEQVCQACADGILIEDGLQASVRLILRNCP